MWRDRYVAPGRAMQGWSTVDNQLSQQNKSSDPVAGPTVDAHAHIYRLDTPMPDSAWHQPTHNATLEDYLKEIGRAGITHAVFSAASINGDYNDYMIDAIAARPGLRATAIVDPEIDPFILKMMKQAGIVGVRLQLRNLGSPPDLTSFSYQKLFRRVADLGWHIQLHDEGDRIHQFIETIEQAGPNLVIDHFGRPPASGGLDAEGFVSVLRALDRGKTWVKLSGAFRLKDRALAPQYAQRLLQCGGPERLLWGSDWPFAAFEGTVTYPDVVADYCLNVPDPKVRAAIDQTALEFYFS